MAIYILLIIVGAMLEVFIAVMYIDLPTPVISAEDAKYYAEISELSRKIAIKKLQIEYDNLSQQKVN